LPRGKKPFRHSFILPTTGIRPPNSRAFSQPFSTKLSHLWKTFTIQHYSGWTFFITYRTFAMKPLKTNGFKYIENVQKKSKKLLTPPFNSAKLTPHTEQKTENTDKK